MLLFFKKEGLALRHPPNDRLCQVTGARRSAKIPRAHAVRDDSVADGGAQPVAQVVQTGMVEHQSDSEQQGRRIGDATAGDVGCRSVHGFEDGGVGADVGTRCEAQPADQAGDKVGEDVTEQVGGHDDVELPRVEHELHGAGVHDAVVHHHAALVFGCHLAADVEENACQRLEDVGFVDQGDFLAAVGDGVFEGMADDAAAAGAGVEAGGERHCLVVVADRHVVLEGGVEAVEVLAHQGDVDVVVTPAGNEREGRPHVGEQLEFAAQFHVDGLEAAADRGGERTLQSELGAADAVQRGGGQRVAVGGDGGEAGGRGLPREGGT